MKFATAFNVFMSVQSIRKKGELRCVVYFQGYRNREIFITTQAPLKRLLEEFWRMIWEYECYVLVMLANLVEDDEVRNEREMLRDFETSLILLYKRNM